MLSRSPRWSGTKHTNKLMERDDVLSQFVHDTVEETNNLRDVLKRNDLWTEYTAYCKGRYQPLKYSMFNNEIERLLGAPVPKSDRLSNFWRGKRLTLGES